MCELELAQLSVHQTLACLLCCNHVLQSIAGGRILYLLSVLAIELDVEM